MLKAGLRLPAHKLRDLVADVLPEYGLAGGDGLQCGHDACVVLLEQVPAGPGADRPDNILVVEKCREQKNLRGRILAEDFFSCSEAVHVLHPDVHEKNIGLLFAENADRVFAVSAGCADGHLRIGLQNGFKSDCDERVIVDHCDIHVFILPCVCILYT